MAHALSASPVAARNSEIARICQEVAEAGWGAQSTDVGGRKGYNAKAGRGVAGTAGKFRGVSWSDELSVPAHR